MSAQLSVVAEASLPQPPSSEEFFGRLEKLVKPDDITPADTALFGDTFEEEKGNGHTWKNFIKGMNAIRDFECVLEAKGLTLSKLDDWFTAFSKWKLSPEALFEAPEEQEICVKRRNELASLAGVTVRAWCPTTLKTTINVLALKYRETAPPTAICSSSTKQFPNYNKIWNAASKRWKDLGARQDVVAVLEDHEVVQLYDQTNFSSLYEAQRMNLVVLFFSLGQRADNMISLRVGHFHLSQGSDGRENLVVNFPTMKNLQAKQSNSSRDAHKQTILPHPDAKVCGIAAYKRQLSMLLDKTKDGHFFISLRVTSKNLGAGEPITYSTIRGAATWARTVVGRAVTSKDLGRRPVMTRLGNALGSYEAAKAMGVANRTVERYHVAGGDVNKRAAEALITVR